MQWSVPKLWPGETAFLLAGGPSLKGFDAEVLRGHGRVIVVNDAWRLCPWFDCLYFSDERWYTDSILKGQWDYKRTISFGQVLYKRLLVSGALGDAFRDHPQVKQLTFTGQLGIETDPRGLRHGSNSTYAAMNLAVHFGVKRIVLLGVDMRAIGKRTHFHDEPRAANFVDQIEKSFLPCFPYLVEPLAAAGVEVVNATPGSALACWPIVSLSNILIEHLEGVT